MPLLPLGPNDPFEAVGKLLGDTASGFSSGFNQGFNASTAPSQSGFGTRQSRVPNNRIAVTKRKLMRWLVPEQPIVEMYLNPQNVQYQYSKHITNQRTKGGYALQYWGENLTNLVLQGTTGTSGIEGINVLYDVYRNEQLMFDPFALALQAERDRILQEQLNEDIIADNFEAGNIVGGLAGIAGETVGNLAGGISGILQSASETGVPAISRERPTLASLAFTVELYWSGEVYRGYFEGFSVTESTNHMGMFEYTINYKVTQRRGFRQNFLGHHRSAVNGPSNSNIITGVPHSFGALSSGAITGRNNIDQSNLNSPFAQINSGLNSIGGQAGVTNRSEGIIDAFDV